GKVSSIPMFLSVTPAPAIKDKPTGGVTLAKAKFIISTIPKWIGSILYSNATGMKIGANKTINAVTSKNIPKTNKITETINKNSKGVLANCKKKLDIISGTRLAVSTNVSELAADIIIKIVAEVIADEAMTSLNLLIVSCL